MPALHKLGYAMMALAVALAGLVAAIVWTDEPARNAAVKSAAQGPTEPLKRSDPGFEPWKEEAIDLSSPEETVPEEPVPTLEEPARKEPASEEPATKEPEKSPEPEPEESQEQEPEPEPQPVIEGEPPEPTAEQVSSAHEPRHYELPSGAVMGLTINALDIHNAPVFDSVGEWALGHGVGHHPETSMPWSNSSQRNVYLAGHRLGYPDTASHLVFYRLGELGRGDGILLKDRDGTRYLYRVSEAFKAEPGDSWVTAQVPGRDIVTLQTCTGENWERRLIVRADRV